MFHCLFHYEIVITNTDSVIYIDLQAINQDLENKTSFEFLINFNKNKRTIKVIQTIAF